jgi:elongation factor P hydroxylase
VIEPEIQESEEVDEELRELRTQPASYDACRSILSAVFLTAIQDCRIDLEEFKYKRNVDGRFNEKNRAFRDKITWKKRLQLDASNWLFGVPDKLASDGFTFQQCCELLDLDMEEVRERIKMVSTRDLD